MTPGEPQQRGEEHDPAETTPLNDQEQRVVEDHVPLRSPMIYEVVRQDGEEELLRPLQSLWWSGLAAGVAISASLLAEGVLLHYLPEASWRPLIVHFGYCVGFLIVILGRLQLFTENTITAVLPLLANWSSSTLAQTARQWSVVLLANLAGTFVTALIALYAGVGPEAHVEAMLHVSREFAAHPASEALLYGIPAGFFVALIVWVLPNSKGSEFWVIVTLTYLISVGGFTHVVVGSAEVFLLLLAGEIPLSQALLGLLLPTLIGNIIGGTGLFAMLAYGQVREEMS